MMTHLTTLIIQIIQNVNTAAAKCKNLEDLAIWIGTDVEIVERNLPKNLTELEIYMIYEIGGLIFICFIFLMIMLKKQNNSIKSIISERESAIHFKNINYSTFVESIISKENEIRSLFDNNKQIYNAFYATIENIVMNKDFLDENIKNVFEKSEDILFKLLQMAKIEISDKEKEYLSVSIRTVVRLFRNDPENAVKLMSVPVD